MKDFLLNFIPMFVAVDAVGVLPVFIALTKGVERKRLRRIIISSVITAILVTFTFILVGQTILEFLGITIADFMIAGGILLLAISLADLLRTSKDETSADPESLGAVPLGVPLIAGPAVLTTGLVLSSRDGPLLTLISTFINIVLVGVTLWMSEKINAYLGNSGSKALSKVAHLLLAAISVMLIRRGILMIAGHME
jgi:multiple antibiotic resistance protein